LFFLNRRNYKVFLL